MQIYYWIRPAKNEDVKQLVKMEAVDFPPTEKEIPWDTKDFKYYIDNFNALVLVADTEKQIIAKITGLIYNGHVNRGLQILDLAVHKKFKRCGIGSELLKTIEELSKHLGCTYAALNVKYNNHAAIKMYCNHGYKIIDKEINILQRMKKELV